jgi:hypothetical protein
MSNEIDEEIMRRTNEDLSGLEETSEGDRIWFEEHPDRNFRLREATAHEKSVGTHRDQVLVYQVEPGVRVRAPVRADVEGELRECFYQLASNYSGSNIDEILAELRK